jgi:3,4-dihydroxy 2-butanone 4-phosphate synthase/GTP cyclohydrolase II
VAVFGDVEKGEGVPCRIHKEQPVTDLFERTGRVRDWVQVAVERFQAERRGVLIFLRSPLVSDLTEDGDAGEERHSSAVSRMQRWREVGVGAQILRDLDVCSIKVLATSPRDYVGLGGFGIEIADTIIVEN